MILDILTVMFLIGSCALLACMFWERRRDVLHGPYVTREDVRPRKEAKRPVQPPQDALEEISRIVRNIDIDSNNDGQKAKGK